MRRHLTRLMTRRKAADRKRAEIDASLDEALPEAVKVLDVLEVARLMEMTPPGLYKRLARLGVQRPKRGGGHSPTPASTDGP